MYSLQGERKQGVELDTILLYNLESLITKYEQNIFNSIVKKEYDVCKSKLTQFCLDLIDLQDGEQVFIAKTFFVGIITDIIKVHTRKNQLHPKILAASYDTIAQIEQYENLSEYILNIPDIVENICSYIIGDHILFEGNIHLEKALDLINFNLKKKHLTVRWIAKQLNISTTHLSNLFKLQVGDTITHYITKRKIEEISFAIQHSNQSIEAIRIDYGYINQSHFIQIFKKIKGVTPLQYRQQFY